MPENIWLVFIIGPSLFLLALVLSFGREIRMAATKGIINIFAWSLVCFAIVTLFLAESGGKVLDKLGSVSSSRKWFVLPELQPDTGLCIKTRSGAYIFKLTNPQNGEAEIKEGPRFTPGEKVYIGCCYGPGTLSYRWRVIRRGAHLVLERRAAHQFDPSRIEYDGAIESWEISGEERG